MNISGCGQLSSMLSFGFAYQESFAFRGSGGDLKMQWIMPRWPSG